jgi:hypothetical protein
MERLPEEQKIRWKEEKKNRTGSHGTILVRELDGGSQIIYESYGPPKKASPGFAAKMGIRLFLPSVLKDFYHEIQARKS